MAPQRTQRRAANVQAKLDRLLRWLGQLRKGNHRGYNTIRRVTRVIGTTIDGEPSVIRGVLVADNLIMTAKREFFEVSEEEAQSVSIAHVAAIYDIDDIQARYRTAQERWKSAHRKSA